MKRIPRIFKHGLWMLLAAKELSAQEIEAIGRVDTLEGSVKVIRDGVTIELKKGDPILTGDTIVTDEEASVGVTFIDTYNYYFLILKFYFNLKLIINDFVKIVHKILY